MSRSSNYRSVAMHLSLASIAALSSCRARHEINLDERRNSVSYKITHLPDSWYVELVWVKVFDNGHEPHAILKLRNETELTICYPGDGPGHPVYQHEVLHDGKWQESRLIGWCGTGVHRIELSAHDEVEFRVNLKSLTEPIRVGISLSFIDGPAGIDVWTAPLESVFADGV
jgi:hypothetical protein